MNAELIFRAGILSVAQDGFSVGDEVRAVLAAAVDTQSRLDRYREAGLLRHLTVQTCQEERMDRFPHIIDAMREVAVTFISQGQ